MATKTEERKLTVDERIQELVDAAPPLSDELCARLRELLQPVAVRYIPGVWQ